MFARVTQFRIQSGKSEEFQRAIKAALPMRREEKGFRGLLVLRGGQEAPRDGWLISVWETLEDLRASERGLSYYGALSRVMSCCEGFPAIIEQEVLISDFRAA